MLVVPLKNLGLEENSVQDRSIILLKNEEDRLIREYRNRYKQVVGTDLARELFPEYAESVDSRLRFAGAVQRAAAALADSVFDQIIAEIERGIVIFTGGGTGAGKTTSILRDGEIVDNLKTASIVFDGNFNSFNSSKDKIEKSLTKNVR